MYYNKEAKTFKVTRNERVVRKTTLFKLDKYKVSGDSAREEIVSGCCYYEKGGIEFLVLKCLEGDRVIAKLKESYPLKLPFLYLNEEDAEHFNVPYQEGLILLPKGILIGKVKETYKDLIITIPGFKVYDDFHIIGRDNLIIDLELFLISLIIKTKVNIESIGGFGSIPKNTVLQHRISTKGNRSRNHIVSEDGELKVEVFLPREVFLIEGIEYFSITFDNTFSVKTDTGEIVGELLDDEEAQYTIPDKYFDGRKSIGMYYSGI